MTHCPIGYMILDNDRRMSGESDCAVHQTFAAAAARHRGVREGAPDPLDSSVRGTAPGIDVLLSNFAESEQSDRVSPNLGDFAESQSCSIESHRVPLESYQILSLNIESYRVISSISVSRVPLNPVKYRSSPDRVPSEYRHRFPLSLDRVLAESLSSTGTRTPYSGQCAAVCRQCAAVCRQCAAVCRSPADDVDGVVLTGLSATR